MTPKHAPIVWSKLTRVLHWGLVICVLANFINDGDGNKDAHRIVGFAASGFVFLRVLYGFLGPGSNQSHHRFYNWPLGTRDLRDFLRSEMSGQARDYEGHNPAASWTYLGIWATILGLGATGYMMGLDAYWGEEWLEELHEMMTKVLLALTLIHLVGIAKDAFKFKRKTWNRMISGRY